VARTFKKSFKGKAVAIVKPFSNVGEKRSPGLVKETGNNKTDLLNLLYDFKSDEEAAAASAQPDGRGQISSATAKACGDDSGLITPPPTSASSATAVRPADGQTGSAAASASPAAKKTRGGGLHKSSFVPRKLKFGAELKAVRVRVEKLQRSPKTEPADENSDLDNCPAVPEDKESKAPVSASSVATSEESPVAKSLIAATKEEPLDTVPAVGDFSAVKKERRPSECTASAIPSDVKPGRAPFRLTDTC
jgi:hypothetical protein